MFTQSNPGNPEIGIFLDPAPCAIIRARKKMERQEWKKMVADETLSDASDIAQAIRVYDLTRRVKIQPLPARLTATHDIVADGARKA